MLADRRVRDWDAEDESIKLDVFLDWGHEIGLILREFLRGRREKGVERKVVGLPFNIEAI